MTDNPSDCRIPFLPVEKAKRLGKEYGVPSSMAHLNVFRVMLNHPELAAAVSNLLATLLYEANKLDLRLRELIIMRIAWQTGSVYEWTQHWRVAEALGIDGESVVGVSAMPPALDPVNPTA